jgi:hypothetical protein
VLLFIDRSSSRGGREASVNGSHGEGGGPWRIIGQGGGEELRLAGGKDKRREGIMPAGAHTAVEAREEQAKESQQQLGREQRFLSPGSGGSHLLRTFLSHPLSGHVAIRLLALRYRHLFYFFCRLLLLRYGPDQTYIQSLRASSIASPA